MLFMFLSLSLLSVIDGIPLKKMHSSNLMDEIMSSKDDHKILLNIIADADPEKLNEIVVLVRGLISVSEEELAGLISSSGVADAAYDDAVTTHDTAVSTQTSGLTQLATDLAFAKAVAQSLHEQSNTASQLIHDQSDAAAQLIHDQGVVSLQGVVDVAKSAKDVASEAKNTANGVLAADSNRLNSEISTLYQVIALIQGVIGINTVAPTMSPTTEAPTMSPTSGSQACEGTEEISMVTCVSSTQIVGYGCQNAIDGDTNTDWATQQEGAGAWIQLYFDGMYYVNSVELTHRLGPELFKDLTFEFSNGQSDGPFTLDNINGGSKLFSLTDNILSSYIKIKATSHYSKINNGFKEIKVYGCPDTTTIRTADEYKYHLALTLLNDPFNVEVKVQANNDAHIFVGEPDQNDGYEIVLGGSANTWSGIREGKQSANLITKNGRSVDSSKFITFNIRKHGSSLIVMREGQLFMQYDGASKQVTSMWFSTGWGSTGIWEAKLGVITYNLFSNRNTYTGAGGINIDDQPVVVSDPDGCKARCSADITCDCVTYYRPTMNCWKRKDCVADNFNTNSLFDVYMKIA